LFAQQEKIEIKKNKNFSENSKFWKTNKKFLPKLKILSKIERFATLSFL